MSAFHQVTHLYGKAASTDFNSCTEFSLPPFPPPKLLQELLIFHPVPIPRPNPPRWLNFHPVPRHHGSSSYNAKGLKYAPPIMTQNNFSVILNFQCTQSPKSEWKKNCSTRPYGGLRSFFCSFFFILLQVCHDFTPSTVVIFLLNFQMMSDIDTFFVLCP